MSDVVIVAIVNGIPAILVSVLSILNHFKIDKVSARVKDTSIKMGELEKNTNDKMDKLLIAKDELRTSTNQAEFTKGLDKGLKEGQTLKESKEGKIT